MKKVVVFSGSGISKDSGIPTYRDEDDSVWNNIDHSKFASKEAWKNNRQGVLYYLNSFRDLVKNSQPNEAHKLIAELESRFEVVIVTQNCDDLHERGGSSKVIHLHGDITVNRSTLKPKLKYPKTYKPILIGDKCEFGSQLRHDVVLFGEILDDRIISETIDHIKSSDVFLIIGTSLSVYPANSLINYVNDDCEVFLIDPNDIQINHNHITHIKDSAINGLIFLTKKLFKEYVE